MYRVRVELVLEDFSEMDSAIETLTEAVQQPESLPYHNQIKSSDSRSEAQISVEEFDPQTRRRVQPRPHEEDITLH